MRRDGTVPREGAAQPAYGFSLFVVWALLALPAILAHHPPLHDYPNHVARAFLLARLGTLPDLQPHYAISWLPYPNLAFDLIAAPLCRWIDPHLVGRGFLIALPAWFLFGAHRLAHALHGRRSAAVPLAGFFFYNTLTLYGFLSYGFGVGLYLLVLSLWLQHRRSPSPGRLWGLVLGAVACYLAHGSAWIFLAVSVIGLLLLDDDRLSPRIWLRHAGFLLAPVLVAAAGGVSSLTGPRVWDSPFGKLKGLGSLVVLYHPGWDAVITLGFLATVLIALIAAVRVGKAALHPGAAVLAAAFVALFLIAPSEIGGTWAADRRFLFPAATLALLAVRWDAGAVAWINVPWAIALGFVCVRALGVVSEWPGLSRDLEQRVNLLQAVPAGARLYGLALVDRRDKSHWARQMGLVHLHASAVVDRAAFANGLFAKDNQQPLRERVPVVPVPAPLPTLDLAPAQVDWPGIFGHHDYVFVSKSIGSYREYLDQRCVIVAQTADAALYRGCRVEPRRRP